MKKDNFSKKFKFYRTRNKNSHIHLYIKTQPGLVDFGPKSNGGNATVLILDKLIVKFELLITEQYKLKKFFKL